MIGNAVRGSGFRGLQNYLLEDPERISWTSNRNLDISDPSRAAFRMRSTAEASRRVEEPVYHLSISAEAPNQLSQADWEKVADRLLQKLDLQEHQALLVSHRDKGHDHIHLMVNRVHEATGKAANLSHDYAKIETELRKVERDLSHRLVPGPHSPVNGERPATARSLSRGEAQVAKAGKEPLVDLARRTARAPLLEAAGWRDLHRRLADSGFVLEKRGRGAVLRRGDQTVKLSRIDRKASFGALEKRLGPYREPASYTASDLRQALRTAHDWEDVHQNLQSAGVAVEVGKRGEVAVRLPHETRSRDLSSFAEADSLRQRSGLTFAEYRTLRRELLTSVDALATREAHQRRFAEITARATQVTKAHADLPAALASANSAVRTATSDVRTHLTRAFGEAEGAAGRALLQHARQHGWTATRAALRAHPERFAPLRPRPRFGRSPLGKNALPDLDRSLARFGRARAARRGAVRATGQARRVQHNARRAFRLASRGAQAIARKSPLQLSVAGLAGRLGRGLARKLLPAPLLPLFEAALRAARAARRAASKDRDR